VYLLDTNILLALIRNRQLGQFIEATYQPLKQADPAHKDFDHLHPSHIQRIYIDPNSASHQTHPRRTQPRESHGLRRSSIHLRRIFFTTSPCSRSAFSISARGGRAGR